MSRTTDIGVTRSADVDLSASQYLCVIATAANGCNLAAANGVGLGILQNKPTLGQAAEVLLAPSLTKAVAGGAFNPGDPLKTDAAGRLVAAGGEAAGVIVQIVAHAMEAAAALGNIVEVQLRTYTINRAVS